jgi:alpha-glucosidase
VDYQSFFPRVGDQRVCHYDVHNLYGAMMTRATSEGLTRLLPHRFLLFSRSSYIGASRYGGVWTGDNTSKWEHLMLNVRHMPSLNLCGFLYSGADTGGFMGNCDRELLLRWLAFSVFTPLMRNHSGKFTKNQEAYRFGDTEAFRRILSARYRLLPYLYSEYMKAALQSDMYIKPLSFVWDDPEAIPIEDQLLVGDSIMIAPVVRQGATERRVYLPEDMTQVRYDGTDFTCTPLSRGWHTVAVAVDELVFYIRKGKLLPIGKPIHNTRDYDVENLELLGDGAQYQLYTDDGLTRDCTMDNVRILKR